jgi:hypothetical protein
MHIQILFIPDAYPNSFHPCCIPKFFSSLMHIQILFIPESVTVTWQCCKYCNTKLGTLVWQKSSRWWVYTYQRAGRRNPLYTLPWVPKSGVRGGAGQQFAGCTVSAVIDLLPTPFPCFPQTSCLKYRRELHLCCIITQEWKGEIQIGCY